MVNEIFLFNFYSLSAVSRFIWLLTPRAVRTHQTKADLETEAYIVAYILPYSALFHILHL